jgi:hypothetical protein
MTLQHCTFGSGIVAVAAGDFCSKCRPRPSLDPLGRSGRGER